jgi:hypothetical protein
MKIKKVTLNEVWRRRMLACGMLILISLTTVACKSAEYAGPIADFGTASTAVIQQTKAAYQMVNDAIVQEKVLAMVTKPPPIGDPTQLFAPYLTDEDIAIRQKMLDGLQGYAAALGNLTGKSHTDLDAQTTALGKSLTDLAANDRLQHSFREVKDVPPDAINAAVTGVRAIGSLLIDAKIRSQLPAIVEKQAPNIEAVAKILGYEIGEPPSSKEPGRLRNELWITYRRLIEDQAKVVDAAKPGSPEKEHAIQVLATLVNQQRTSDAALSGTKDALTTLVAAHKALRDVNATPDTFKTTVAALWGEIKSAQTYYDSLSKK